MVLSQGYTKTYQNGHPCLGALYMPVAKRLHMRGRCNDSIIESCVIMQSINYMTHANHVHTMVYILYMYCIEKSINVSITRITRVYYNTWPEAIFVYFTRSTLFTTFLT